MSFLSVFLEYAGVLLDYKWVILFYSFIIFFVYRNRKNFTKEAPLVYLYKTRLGLGLMDSMSKKFRSAVRLFGYVSIFLGYIGFVLISYLLVRNAYDIIVQKPGVVGASPVIPGLPIQGLGIVFPLIIGWISLFIIMIVHEFAHGVVARAHDIKVKSSGIAFFGPILGAFVEPDEKEIVKKSYMVQNSVYSAGPISNVFLWGVCMLFLLGMSAAAVNMTYSEGVTVNIIKNETLPAYASGMQDNTTIIAINGNPTINFSSLDIELERLRPGDNISVSTLDGETFELTTTVNPNNSSKAYLGILLAGENRKLKDTSTFSNILYGMLSWFFELFNWTALISLNIGLINLFPIFITDGARILKANTDHFFSRNRELGDKIWKNVSIASVFILLVLLIPMVRGFLVFVLNLLLAIVGIRR